MANPHTLNAMICLGGNAVLMKRRHGVGPISGQKAARSLRPQPDVDHDARPRQSAEDHAAEN